MSPTQQEPIGDLLTVTVERPLRLVQSDRLQQLQEALLADNLELINSYLLAQSASPPLDVGDSVAQSFARLDARMDLMSRLLVNSLRANGDLPASSLIAISAAGFRLQQEIDAPSMSACLVELGLGNDMPILLRWPVQPDARESGLFWFASDDRLQSALQRYVFAIHRKQLAERAPGPSDHQEQA